MDIIRPLENCCSIERNHHCMDTFILLSCAGGYGGAEKSLELLASELASRGLVVVFAENKNHIDALSQIKGNIVVVPVPSGKSPGVILKSLSVIKRYLNKYREAKILVNTNKGALYLSLVSYITSLTRKKIIIYVRDYQWKYIRFIFSKLKNAEYAIPTESILEQDQYLKSFAPRSHIHITGNPVIIPNKQREVEQGTYFLLLANIARWKGIDYLLKAYALSGLYKENITVKICGKVVDEIYFKELQQFMTDNKLSNYVEFIPFQKDTSTLYCNSLAVVNCSISEFGGPETFGRTIIEAWSYKKPVISFACGGPKYIIKNRVNGILISEKNLKKLKEALQELAHNTNFAKYLGENGACTIQNNYSSKIIVGKLQVEFEHS